jgi:FxsC-like protein
MTGYPARRDDARPGSRNSDEFGAEHGGYFFLSYASTPPPRRDSGQDADFVVDKFFSDLYQAVDERRGLSELDIGFCDRSLPVGLDREARVRSALGRAEVLVPLYSPRYFKSISAGREWTVFFRRLLAQNVADPGRHVVPVSWIPLPPGYKYPTGVDVPAEHLAIGGYAEDGLQTMYNLSRHRAVYQRVVAAVAASVVEIAERHRVGPGPTVVVADRELDFPQDSDGPAFAIVVAAPDAQSAHSVRRAVYGQTPSQWRPFGSREELSLAEDAAAIAARFGFIGRVSSLGDKGDSFEEAPGVLLIDPWLAVSAEGRARIAGAVNRLPQWALPIFVTDESDTVSMRLGRPLADLAAELARGAAPQGEAAQRAADVVTTLEDFYEIFPSLVTEAARRYLRYGRVYPEPRTPSARPRIMGPDRGPSDKDV